MIRKGVRDVDVPVWRMVVRRQFSLLSLVWFGVMGRMDGIEWLWGRAGGCRDVV